MSIGIVRKFATGLLCLVAACFVPKSQIESSSAGTLPPSFAEEGWSGDVPAPKYLGRFKVTYYWAVDESAYSESRASSIYLSDGSLLGHFSSAFVKAFKTEAAARLRDGRCVSYLKRRGRAEVVDRFLGYGGHRLTELKSLAVDPRIIPIGSTLYIPQAQQVVVNNVPQSGIFFAHDIGGAVKGKHIDIFVGSKDNMEAFRLAGMRSSGSVDVYLLE